ncbi:MAG: hypothetical protein HRT72_01630 [Flavobacteriales bacterium]|nr:hypothetical protein [Flavobacteriales bacterium]
MNSRFYIVLILLVSVFFGACKKQTSDETYNKYIVGSWRYSSGEYSIGQRVKIVEFSDNGYYRNLEHDRGDDFWNSADTVGLDVDSCDCTYSTFEDSLGYYIENGDLFIYNDYSGEFDNHDMGSLTISKLEMRGKTYKRLN